MLQFKSYRGVIPSEGLYATGEEFDQLFATDTTDLYRLSVLLTANAEQAHRCLILAMKDCLSQGRVTKHRMHTWAHRMVIRNAIRLVCGENDIPDESGFEFQLQPSGFPLEALRESVAILALADLDRVAFVVCVLERYSVLDCALLMRRTPQQVYEAILRATRKVLLVEERNEEDAAILFASKMYHAAWAQAETLERSCRAILD